MATPTDMGHVYADVTFHGLNGRQERRNLMVDTGALYLDPREPGEGSGHCPGRTETLPGGDRGSDPPLDWARH